MAMLHANWARASPSFEPTRTPRLVLIKPNGIGEPLHGELHGFTKCKAKHLGLRVIDRPVRPKSSWKSSP